jgi:hypothetical protein
MRNLNSNETIVALLWTIVISMGSGVLAWHWMNPDANKEILLFIFVWGAITLIGHFISAGVVAKIANGEAAGSASDSPAEY